MQATATESKPHVVIRIHRPSEVADHYQAMIERSRTDVSHLRELIDRANAEGYTEKVVYRADSAEEAEVLAVQFGRDPVPGVTYRVGWDDSGYTN